MNAPISAYEVLWTFPTVGPCSCRSLKSFRGKTFSADCRHPNPLVHHLSCAALPPRHGPDRCCYRHDSGHFDRCPSLVGTPRYIATKKADDEESDYDRLIVHCSDGPEPFEDDRSPDEIADEEQNRWERNLDNFR
jgi:hypothetical protein